MTENHAKKSTQCWFKDEKNSVHRESIKNTGVNWLMAPMIAALTNVQCTHTHTVRTRTQTSYWKPSDHYRSPRSNFVHCKYLCCFGCCCRYGLRCCCCCFLFYYPTCLCLIFISCSLSLSRSPSLCWSFFIQPENKKTTTTTTKRNYSARTFETRTLFCKFLSVLPASKLFVFNFQATNSFFPSFWFWKLFRSVRFSSVFSFVCCFFN